MEKTYKVPTKDGFGKMFAVIIFNQPRAERIASYFNFKVGHKAPYQCPLGRGTVFEIIETDRKKALSIINSI